MKISCPVLIGWLSMFILLSVLAMPADPVSAAGGFGRAEIGGSKLKQLSAAQVAERKALSQFLKSLEGKSDRTFIYKVKGPVSEISSDTLGTLFPKWSFYVVPYDMKKNPRFKGPMAIPGGLYSVFGAKDSGETAEFASSGNHEDVGKFLAAEKVTLRNAQEGRQLWNAICHLLRQGTPNSESRKEGPNLWYLGVEVSGDEEFYYEMRTAEDGTVLSGKLQFRRLKKEKS
jgi:hypothetical protein